jgi:hypothetical protein
MIGGNVRAWGGLSNKSNKLELDMILTQLRGFDSNWLHSKGANFNMDILGEPIGDKMVGDNVGDWSGVNNISSLSEWWEKFELVERAGEGGAERAKRMTGWLVYCWWWPIVFWTDLVVLRTRLLLGDVWIRTWRVNSSDLENFFAQPGKVHWCGFSPVCVRIWRVWCSRR